VTRRTPPAGPVIRLDGVARDFFDGRQTRRVLHPLTLEFGPGEFTIVSGPSGSGKTTLLTIMALILNPTEGRVFVHGRDVTAASEDVRATLRLRNYGFVFQNAALIPALTALENVLIAASVQGAPVTRAVRARAEAALDRLGLLDFLNVKVDRLSGGQKQRVAIGRALVNDPGLILCDEPTSALDVDSSAVVLHTLKELSRDDRAVVLVTHDPRVYPYADRLIALEDGRMATDTGSLSMKKENTR
jgi:putative ABC transport system ATP-binding protein